jgi:hypothetical protein
MFKRGVGEIEVRLRSLVRDEVDKFLESVRKLPSGVVLQLQAYTDLDTYANTVAMMLIIQMQVLWKGCCL